MTRQKWMTDLVVTEEKMNLNNWPTVNLDSLADSDLQTFLNRKKAIEMYVKQTFTVKNITDVTGIQRSNIQRLLKRCFELDEYGEIWGYRALIPSKRIKKYTRNKEVRSSDSMLPSHYVGSFNKLLNEYPDIKSTIDSLFFGKSKQSINSPVIKGKDLHKKFISLCTFHGIKMNQYPFNTNDLGRRSLYRYIKVLELSNFGKSSARYGKEVSQKALRTGIGIQNNPMILKPLKRVQIDGHRIDCSIAIIFHTPEGDEFTEILNRIWIIAAIDVATRVVLGYHLSFSKEYTASDVLHCIKNSITPHVSKELTIPNLMYHSSGGFASEVFDEMKWALWDECWFDNARANLSLQVKEKLNRNMGCSVNAGPVAVPVRRSYIERFFGILEEYGYHKLINTTGNSPKDPRRNNPEDKAIKYQINVNELEELTEVLISNYNGTPHEGINNLSPLQCLEQRLSRNILPRVLSEEDRNEMTFFSFSVIREIKGNVKSGKRPYVYYYGVEYRNDVLASSAHLIGMKLKLKVNIDDIRTVKVYLEDGSEFGILTANGKWGIIPHSLQTRKSINKLRNKKLLHFTYFDDPIEKYHNYLRHKSIKSKQHRNTYATLTKYQKRKEEEQSTNEQKNPVKTIHPPQEPDNSTAQIDVKRFRTINY